MIMPKNFRPPDPYEAQKLVLGAGFVTAAVILAMFLLLANCGGNPGPGPLPTPTPTPEPTPEPTPPPSPPPTEPKLLFGYYYATGKHGNFWSEVEPYVNLNRDYVGNAPGDDSYETWSARLARDVKRVCEAKRQVMLGLCYGCLANAWWEDAVNRLRDSWPCVTYLELADEPGWTVAQARARVQRTKEGLDRLQLPHRPIGLVVQNERAAEYKAAFGGEDGLDWLGIETYVTAPGGSRDENAQVVLDTLRRVPMSIPNVFVIGQAYDRNGNWRSVETLADLQDDTFDIAKTVLGNRLRGFVMFSYGRQGGTRAYPEVKARHKRFSKREGIVEP